MLGFSQALVAQMRLGRAVATKQRETEMDGMEMRYNLLAIAALAVSFGAFGPETARAQDDAMIAEGEKVFRRCAACHQVGPDAVNRVGPELSDLIGRTAGTVPDFKYSDAMIEKGAGGLVWSEETLFEYLEAPRTYVKGTNMAFAGLKKPEEREAVIAYIVSQQGPAS